jgi:hypothetical protein
LGTTQQTCAAGQHDAPPIDASNLADDQIDIMLIESPREIVEGQGAY